LAHEGPLLLFMFIILLAGYFLVGNSGSTMLMVFVQYFVMASVGNALHMSFHVRGFHLEKYAWYLELRTLHYIHHIGDMKTNLAMLNMGMDGLFHSLDVVDSNHEEHTRANGSSGAYDEIAQLLRGIIAGKFTLPAGVDEAAIYKAAAHAGATATILGLDVPMDMKEKQKMSSKRRGQYPTVLLRLILCAGAMAAWFATEGYASHHLISRQPHQLAPANAASDPGLELFKPLGQWLHQRGWATSACAFSAAASETSICVIILASVLGPTFRPMLSVVAVFVIRLLVDFLGAAFVIPQVPYPVWALPAGWPTFFVQHNNHENAFFSARVALASIAACELLCLFLYNHNIGRLQRNIAAVVAFMYVAFNVVLSLALRASWSFDILIAIVIARYATIFGERLSVFVNAFMP